MSRISALITFVVLAGLFGACGGGSDSTESKGSDAGPSTLSSRTAQLAVTPSFRAPGEDRLVIRKIALDAPLGIEVVPPNGNLPNPNGADDVALYDFSQNFPAYGGPPGDSGNILLSGNVDSGSTPCQGGRIPPPCRAVFWNLSALTTGDEIALRLRSKDLKYTVAAVCYIEIREFNDAFVSRIMKEPLTLTTPAGRFDSATRSYSHFVYVLARKQGETASNSCPVGTEAGPSAAADVSDISLPAVIRPGRSLSIRAQAQAGVQCRLLLFSGSEAMFATVNGTDSSPAGTVAFTPFELPEGFTTGKVEVSCGGAVQSKAIVISPPTTPTANGALLLGVDFTTQPATGLGSARGPGTTQSGLSYDRRVENGEFVIQLQSGNTGAVYIGSYSATQTNFAVDLDARSEGVLAKLMLGIPLVNGNNDSILTQLVAVSGDVNVVQAQGGRFPILASAPGAAKKQAPGMNRLRLEVRGSELKVFLEGELVAALTDAVLDTRPLRVNLAGWARTAIEEGEDARVIFDNVKISALP